MSDNQSSEYHQTVNIGKPDIIAVRILKFKQGGFSIQQWLLKMCATGEKNANAAAEDRIPDPPHVKQILFRVPIKAGLYRKAVQVCYIPNTTT